MESSSFPTPEIDFSTIVSHNKQSTLNPAQQHFDSKISKSKQQLNTIETPLWTSDPIPLRNDYLRFFQNGTTKTSFIVNLDEFKFIVLGRSSSCCHYIMTHPTISRKHALIGHDEKGYIQIIDLNSLQGTFIDSKRIPPSIPHQLKGGEKIRFGEDPSFLLVNRNINYENQVTAQNLLEKKKLLRVDSIYCIYNTQTNSTKNVDSNNKSNSNNNKSSQDDTDDDETPSEMEIYKQEVTKFLTHLNKTGALENDLMTRNTIDQITPSASPKKQKYSGNKRKLQDCVAPNSSKSVSVKEQVQRFTFSNDEQLQNFTVELAPINYLSSYNSTYSPNNIISVTGLSKFNSNDQQDKQQIETIIVEDDDEDISDKHRYKKRLNFGSDNDETPIPTIIEPIQQQEIITSSCESIENSSSSDNSISPPIIHV
ncbi:hypothetical protein DLAC_02729 [Tieghemostelium lacteum]|uniref:FHA domain-containing protein n=1 Tax=Tieghemostelium lacteum TaxID=361077 RepID=A0A152A3S1_TIELA|nr:hypothetical protein DLAC_02729 [Tieghemostelium lacteum]|eukprot:KYR00691.1 hypothetical protein DLAC_02729 [Tieghemostelium lacteum]